MSNQRNWKEITLDNNSDVWDRQEPIEGKLVKTEHDIGPNKSKMYVFEQDGKEIKVWGSTVLDDKLIGIPSGTFVKIEYEGKLKSKKGAEYHSYKVYIDEDSVPAAPQSDPLPTPPEGEEIDLDNIPF